MTDIAINHIVNPFSRLVTLFIRSFEKAGMARAAVELRRMGYYKEADLALKRLKDYE